MSFDIEKIKNDIHSNSGKAVSPTVYISTANGGIIKVINVTTNPTIVNVCNLSYSWTDIAINKDKDIYMTTTSAIVKVKESNCTAQTFFNNPEYYMVALSFDTKNNLYISNGTEVLRFNNSSGSPTLWKDFGSGTASGDFVMKNDKMYISWDNGGVDLYEVTVDANINYISHKNKCRIKSKTYGLASELGQLYGITPTELYKIDEEKCQYTTVLSNNSGVSWYGAAGYHEAQSSVTAHLTYTDAVKLSNTIGGIWKNTVPYNQIIYVAINDKIRDSILIYPVKISIIPSIKTNESKTICRGTSYKGYSQEGSYIQKLKSKDGCDSTHNIELKIQDTIFHSINVAICEGESYKNYNTSGTYKDTYKTNNSCDSIVTIRLIVNPKPIVTKHKTICQGKIYAGRTTSGSYRDTFKTKAGCDSIRILHLTVITIPKPIVDKDACIVSNQRFKFYSQIITAPGIYIDSTNHIEECDSIFRLHVHLEIPKSDTMAYTKCQGYIFKDIQLMSDTSLFDTLRSWLGCDSIYRLHRINIQKLLPSSAITRFYCDTFQYRNNVYDYNSTVRDTLRYSVFPYCDSLHRVFQYRKAPKPTISIYTTSGNYLVKGEAMTIAAKGADSYLWSTNETTAAIRIQPAQNSKYWAIGSNEYRCLDTTFIDIEVEDFIHFDLPAAFTPNGDGNNDEWTPNSSGEYRIVHLDIFNRWGEKVFSGDNKTRSWNGTYKGQMQNAGLFTYYILVEKNRRLFERKGSFTLMR